VIEMANASGLSIAGAISVTTDESFHDRHRTAHPAGDFAGCRAGHRRLRGSATTDGGAGALEAIGSPEAVRGVELVAAAM